MILSKGLVAEKSHLFCIIISYITFFVKIYTYRILGTTRFLRLKFSTLSDEDFSNGEAHP